MFKVLENNLIKKVCTFKGPANMDFFKDCWLKNKIN